MYRSLLLLLLSSSALISLPKEGKEIPKEGGFAEVALKTKNPSVAVCTYGMHFSKGGDMGSKETANLVKAFAKKKGMYAKAVSIPSLFDVDPLINNLLDVNNGELAADILAIKAYQNIMFEGADLRSAPSDDGGMVEEEEIKGKKGKKGKKNKKSKKGKKGNDGGSMTTPTTVALNIPDALFASKSKKTQYLAILAAAYTMQSSYADRVNSVEPKSAEIASAKLLFKVMTGGALAAKEVKAAFDKSQRVNDPIVGASIFLSYVNMNVPAMSTLMEALGRTKDKTYLPLIHKALSSKDERVRIDAVRALRKIGDQSSVPYLLKMLDKAEWTSLIEVCLALGEIPDKASLAPLIKRFQKETGRFRLDCNYAIASIAGKRVGYKVEEVAEWYKKNYKSFQVDLEKSKAFRAAVRLQDVGVPVLGTFYSIGLYSDRCCFVVDYSASMKGDKIESLKENMTSAITHMKDFVQFNISEFGGDVNVFYDGALVDDKKKAVAYVERQPMTGGTRSMDAFERGMMVSPEVDTVYFLSDGAPVRGQLEKWGEISKLIRLKNRYRHIAMSTICFKAGKSNAVSMENVANENYGHTEEIQ